MSQPANAGAKSNLAVVTFTVRGLSDAYLKGYLDELSALRNNPEVSVVGRQRRAHHRPRTSPDSPTAPRIPGKSLHEVHSVEELSFAVVSDHDELGAWGRTFPVPLVPVAADDGTTVYTGQASLPLTALEAYQRAGSPSDKRPPLTCRLVIIKSSLLSTPPLPAIQASPGSVILAVDNAHTYPRPVHLQSLKLPAKVDLADAAALTDVSKVEMLLQGEEAWEAIVDVADQGISDNHPHPFPEALPNVRFSPVETQFPFLRTLARESPSTARQRSLQPPPRTEVTGFDVEDDTVSNRGLGMVPQRGPMLSLSFFGNDPRKRYNREEWLASLPSSLQASVVEEDMVRLDAHAKQAGDGVKAEKDVVLRTVPFSVTRVRPVPMDGSCWCETVLPTPAPLKRQMDEVKREQEQARLAKAKTPPTPPTSVTTDASPNSTHPSVSRGHTNVKPSTASSMASYCGSDSDDEWGLPDAVKGWCVRPLWHARPVAGPGLDVTRTQDWWNCVVDLGCLENHALEIEVEVPLALLPASLRPSVTAPGGKGTGSASRAVRGSTVLISSMFNQDTKGVMQASLPCRLPVYPKGTTTTSGAPVPNQIWVFLHVQYLFVFPYNHDNNDLRVVRSCESYDRLKVPTLVGHRGLGKTYTRRGAKPGQAPMSKLAENSIESLNAAHQRGCAMVEFDVMLTRDRIPVIFHDPMLVLHAKEKQRAARQGDGAVVAAQQAHALDEVERYGMAEGEEDEDSASALAPPYLSAKETTALTRLQRWYLQKLGSFVPIPVAIHSLTKRQLDALVTESFSFGGQEPPRLKILILQHWLQILRIYRNRARLQCMQDRKMCIQPTDEDEFHGCGDLAAANTFGQPTGPLARQVSVANAAGGLTSPLASSFLSQSALAGAPLTCDGAAVTLPTRYRDPIEGIVPMLGLYKSQLRRANRMLERQVDITNRIPAFYELFLLTPPSLSLNIEVKYPFMPRWDANLFQQTDAFEVNGFVDAILDVVFAYVDEGREIAFSSFEPDICLALAAKQSRYDVLFLSDTEERVDLKDYRSFYLEGAIQFAHANGLAGISINAATLPLARKDTADGAADGRTPEPATRETSMELFNPDKNVTVDGKGEAKAGRVPLVRELVRRKAGGKSIGPSDETELRTMCDWKEGQDMVSAAHARNLKVWTWGDNNSDLFFAYMQGVYMGVDAIITDHVPV